MNYAVCNPTQTLRDGCIRFCTKIRIGDARADQNITASGVGGSSASIVIDKLYIQPGKDGFAGVSMTLNRKEKPFWLRREDDYPSLLKWISYQSVVFYDVSESRSWLVDGASALLHLVRISLYMDKNDPDSTYGWVFDASKLNDKWDGKNGRQSALQTLKRWENLNLPLYTTGPSSSPNEAAQMEYATLEKRVKSILHSLEILIDWQASVESRDGIRIQQSFDVTRDLPGFDTLDIVNPLGPIKARSRRFSSKSPGWVDLINTLGSVIIFGRGFGDLLRPKGSGSSCTKWKAVPHGSDYLAVSVSTLKMLYEQRLLRAEPGLQEGQLSSKLAWMGTQDPFMQCHCSLQQNNPRLTAGHIRAEHNNTDKNGDRGCHDPTQYIVKKSRRPRSLHDARTIDITTLQDAGAVLIGVDISLHGRNSEKETTASKQHKDKNASASSLSIAANKSAGSSHLVPVYSGGGTSSAGTIITPQSTGPVSSNEQQNNIGTGMGTAQMKENKIASWISKLWES